NCPLFAPRPLGGEGPGVRSLPFYVTIRHRKRETTYYVSYMQCLTLRALGQEFCRGHDPLVAYFTVFLIPFKSRRSSVYFSLPRVVNARPKGRSQHWAARPLELGYCAVCLSLPGQLGAGPRRETAGDGVFDKIPPGTGVVPGVLRGVPWQ